MLAWVRKVQFLTSPCNSRDLIQTNNYINQPESLYELALNDLVLRVKVDVQFINILIFKTIKQRDN